MLEFQYAIQQLLVLRFLPVHIGVAMQSLHQMREMQDLTLAAPPARETLALQGCSLRQQTCSWQDFRSIADSAIDRNAVFH